MNNRQRTRKSDKAETANRSQELDMISTAIVQAYRSFNATLDPQLMDACIFEINALRARRNAILREMRQQGGSSDISYNA